jgi:hypothetical protein
MPRQPKTIIRVERRTPHVAMPNATVRDKALSLQACGLLAFVLSYPDDWRMQGIRWIERTRRVGKHRVAAAIHELRRVGYCQVRQERAADGRHGVIIYTFRDVRGQPDPGFRDPARRDPEKWDSTNPESTKTESTNRRTSGQRASRVKDRDDSVDDARALRALTATLLMDRVALAVEQERGQTQVWLLGLVRQAGGRATPVLRAVERCLARIEAGDAGGHARHNAAYIDKAVRRAAGLPLSMRRGPEATVGDVAGGIVGTLRRRSSGAGRTDTGT